MKRFLKGAKIPFIMIVIYLVGLFFGAYALCAYPIYRQKTYFSSEARIIAAEYLEGKDDALMGEINPNMNIYIYDKNGVCLRHEYHSGSSHENEALIRVETCLGAALGGSDVFTVALSDSPSRSLDDIIVVVGVPMLDGGKTAGAVFLTKNLLDLPAATLGYVIYFTVFYWVAGLVIVSNIRKKKKLDAMQRSYIANVTHALKTPVASIKALSETLCDGVEHDPDRQRVYYGMILKESNRLDHMVRDILELSKIQRSGMDFSKSPVPVSDIIAPIEEKYGTLCDYMGIEMQVSEELRRLPPLMTNAACLRQTFELLLDNAIKFVRDGGKISLEAYLAGKTVTFCVRDNGIGIDKDSLPHVFERFFKCSHDFNDSGSGLGLTIAQEISFGLGERIWAESELGKGSAFFFTSRIK